MTPTTTEPEAPPALTADEIREAEARDAASASALAGGEAHVQDPGAPDDGEAGIVGEAVDSGVAGDAEPQPAASREPRTAAARRAAGVPAQPVAAVPVDDRGGDPGPTAAPEAAPASASLGAALPAAGPGENAPLTAEEIDFIHRMRRSRGDEIRAAIAAAPQGVGTNVNVYTLVHLRGCPRPSRTEVYEDRNTSTGQRFTINRCIECGAHQAIPH